jgi:hypothetical protein
MPISKSRRPSVVVRIITAPSFYSNIREYIMACLARNPLFVRPKLQRDVGSEIQILFQKPKWGYWEALRRADTRPGSDPQAAADVQECAERTSFGSHRKGR